jgi:hypothetical protein
MNEAEIPTNEKRSYPLATAEKEIHKYACHSFVRSMCCFQNRTTPASITSKKIRCYELDSRVSLLGAGC